MGTLRSGLAVAVLSASLGLVGAAIMNGRYWEAVSWGLGCLAIEACIFGLSSPWEEGEPYRVLAGIAAAATVVSLLLGSPATNFRRQIAQQDLVDFFLNVVGGVYEQASPRARQLAEHGAALCAVQRYVDIADLASELQRAQHLGPTSSLILGSYELLAAPEMEPPNCLATFREFNRVAPDLGRVFLRRYPDVLRDVDHGKADSAR